MSAVERVMKAYSSKHDLNAEQAVLVRAEISRFIGQLMSGKRREPTMLPEPSSGTAPRHPSARRTITESSPELTERWDSMAGNVRVASIEI
jgi:hypothetical protein